jgi:hypothetical protein
MSEARYTIRAVLAKLIEEIESAVKKFNACLPYRAWDYMVYRVFQDASEVPRDSSERSALLSLRIETLVLAFKVRSMVNYSADTIRHQLATENFARYYWKLIEMDASELSDLSENNSEFVTHEFLETLGEMSRAVGKNSQASFCSKLLHWTFPCAFPMIDSRVRDAVMRKYRAVGIDSLPNNWGLTPVGTYSGLVDFYLKVEEKIGEREKLVDFDFETQPKDLMRIRNSWLRVIDKWLWLEGKRSR